MCFTLDYHGIIRALSVFGADALGYDQNDLVGQAMTHVCHAADRDRFTRQFSAVLQHAAGIEKWQSRKVRKDGSILWVQETARAVPRADGQIEVLIVCEDMTERRQARAQMRAYHMQLRNLASEVSLAEERERRRIATGLHDQLGQLLALVKLKLGEALTLASCGACLQPLEAIREMVDQAIHATRSLTFELSSPILYELGLEAALQSLGEWIEAQYGLRCHVHTDNPSSLLTTETRVLLFRIGRELLFNTVKHARAHCVDVSISHDATHLSLTVHDDGVGFDTCDIGEHVSPTGGFGLFSVRENVERQGGRLEIASVPGAGTRVVVVVPLF